ncbi:MAG: chromosome segregation protein SMC [Bacteroidetes bacterium]|jgi:chromosome segregation protein|nr:chromosome segregation protein SMC [Bacteroidota bacterium]
MYLSRLELHGFKSFAEPTVLQFDEGITAIVGPNGCGKSNIVDAVRWVIGEQRARVLRSDKMENVIFNGTAKRRPLGMAEVQLTIENNRGVLPIEYNEVTLGRRLYRSGTSEYLLNDVVCRLKDITDLFMDTGMGAGAYSVIELKMVDEIISNSHEDRRRLFEEAAGITKYKQRRRQALRKLDTTQADLDRLRDLTEEIEKRVQSLKRQAARAERFQTYEARLHQLELALAQAEYDRLVQQRAALDDDLQRLSDELDAYQARLAEEEATLEALRTTLIEREQVLSERQQRLSDHVERTRSLESDLRVEQERLRNARRDYERTTTEQEEAAARRAELETRVEQLTEALDEAFPACREAEARRDAAQDERDAAQERTDALRSELQALRQRETDTADARADAQRRLDRLTNRLELLEAEQTRLREQIAPLDARLTQQADAVRQAEEALDTAETQARTARAELEAAEEERASRQRDLDAAAQTLQQAEREQAAVTAEVQVLNSLVTSFDEFSDAIQFLADAPDWSPRPLRTVADVLTCDEQHRLALDAALGDLASCLVVETQAEAAAAIARLRADEQGRARFLVLDRLDAAALPQNGAPPDGPTPLWQTVDVTDDAPSSLARLLLHGAFLVDTLDEARHHAQQADAPTRFIARTGEWADARGTEFGGSAHAGASPLADRISRREQLDAARARLADLEDEMDRAAARVEQAEAALDAFSLDDARHAVEQAEAALTDARRTHDRATYEHEQLQQQQADLDDQLATTTENLTAGRADVGPLQQTVADAEERLDALREERAALEATFQEAESASRAAQERLAEAHVAAVEARNRRDNLQRDRDRTQQEIGALLQRAEDRQERLDALQDTIDAATTALQDLEARLDAIRRERSGLDEAVSEAKNALMQVKVDIDEAEKRLRALRSEREQRMKAENERAVRQAEIQTRLQDLIENVEDAFDRDLTGERAEVPVDFDEAEARAEVKDLRQKIKNLGNVNALALEEYESERERLEFLQDQQRDLEQAEDTLLETIDEINTTASERFETTYRAIEKNFHELFAELFGQDATGHLELADPDDPLESPIEIMAKPRGKRPVVLSQLSSGEKTLTAIALLFAIYLVKPSPFCILDEVDAPLDDANVDRFMRLIRRFSDDTQFILVTHNQRTMEMADRLYGITMQEQGVSRLVSVHFDEAIEMAA